jgi:hypothetical protein
MTEYFANFNRILIIIIVIAPVEFRSLMSSLALRTPVASDDDGSSEARPSAMEAEDEALSSRSGIDVAATALAEQGRYLAALASWDAALAQPDIAAEEASPVALDRALRRSIAATHELRAQAMMELDRAFDAIRAASRAVRCDGASP